MEKKLGIPADAPRPETPRELQAVIFAEREMEPFAYFRNGEGEQVVVSLPPGESLTIGRNPSNGLALEFDQTVSGVHAELQWVGGEWVVQDDGLSTNGTFLNGVRVAGQRRLRDGDVLRCGETSLVYRFPAENGRVATRIAGDQPRIEVTPAQLKVLVELCRPAFESRSDLPASNQDVADALFLSVETVKTHIRDLYSAFSLDQAEPRAKRSLLVNRAQQLGVVSASDY